MTPDKPPRLSIHALLFGTTTGNGNADQPVADPGAPPPNPPPTMTQREASIRFAPAGMDNETGADREDGHVGGGGMKRRQPDAGWDTTSSTEPVLRRRASPLVQDERAATLLRMASLGQRDGDGRTALMLAAREGRDDVVGQLLKLPSDQAQAAVVDRYGWNALMLAAQNGHFEVVQQLLALPLVQAQAAVVDRSGINALKLAANYSHFKVVLQLLALPSAHAQLAAESHLSGYAVNFAYERQESGPVLGLLLAAGATAMKYREKILAHTMKLARQGQPAFLWRLPADEVGLVLARLQQTGRDLRAVDEAGWNALMYACVAGRADVVEALMALGVQPSAPMPARVSATIQDLLRQTWELNAPAIERRCLSEALSLDGADQGLMAAGICHTLSVQLMLNDHDQTSLRLALAGVPVMTLAQRSLMQAGLLSWLEDWTMQPVANLLVQNSLSPAARQRLQAQISAQGSQLGVIGADIEAQTLGSTLPGLDDFCLTQVAGLESALLQDDAALRAYTAGLSAQMAEQFGLYGVFTQRVRQALVEALQACRPQLMTQLAAQDADAVATLRAMFKAALKRSLDQVGGGMLQHDALVGAGSAVSGLYAHLVFRQLHMLTQFVNS